MAKNVLLTYSQRREYRVSIPENLGPVEETNVIANAVHEALAHLHANSLYGIELESIKLRIEEK